MAERIILPPLRCQRCRATWTPRVTYRQVRCPRCDSKTWDKPRKNRAG